MGFSCGIVGLPNVGKSTLFNAVTGSSVDASNYPFCTIEPNKALVPLPDDRLDYLSKINKSRKTVPAVVEFVDIAGLVKGASRGEGLGNKFLAHIREVKVIVQVVRLFKESDITHIGEVNPLRDLDVINTELILSDLESIDKKIQSLTKLKGRDKESAAMLEVFEPIKAFLDDGNLLMHYDFSSLDKVKYEWIKNQHFITQKPMMIVANVSESDIHSYQTDPHYQNLKRECEQKKWPLVVLSVKMEQEMSELDPDSLRDYLAMEGIERKGMDVLVTEGYRLLNLITYFTSGETESRAWSITRGTLAPQAAGVIHSDFERGFIKAETLSFEDFKHFGSFSACRENGKLRLEGKNYVVQDGDIMVFKFNV